MKDVVLKGKWIKRELIIIISIYIFANLLNLVSIICYKTEWNELFTSQLFVLYLTEWLYIISVIIRVIHLGLRVLIKKRMLPTEKCPWLIIIFGCFY